MGGSLTAAASQDFTTVSARGLAEFAPRLIDLVADVAMNPTLAGGRGRDSQAAAAAGRSAAEGVAAVRSRTASSGGRCSAITRTRAPRETEASLQAIDRAKVEAFHARHYRPNNAFLLVVGDVDPDAAFAAVEKSVRRVGAGRRAEAVVPRAAGAHGPAVCISSSGPTASSRRSALGNIAIKRGDPRWYELTLANTIYGGAFNSRIVRNIREEKGYTYSPAAHHDRLRRRRLLSIQRRRAQRSDRRDAHRGVQGNRQAARGRERAARSCRARKSYVRGIFPIQTATQGGLAQRAEHGLCVRPAEGLSRKRSSRKIAAVTPEQVKSGADTLLGSEDSVDRHRRRLGEGEGSARRVQGHHVPRRRRKEDVAAAVVR